MENIIVILFFIAIGVFGLIQHIKIKKEDPEKAKFVDKTWQDTPKGMRVSGYEDKNMDRYLDSKSYIIWGIVAVICLLVILFRK